jgi:hypothetical protein
MIISKQLIASLVLIAVIGGIVLFLSLAPLHRVYDADECRDAYARARSVTDTAQVDLHRYAALPGAPYRRCGELRGVHADSSGTLSIR